MNKQIIIIGAGQAASVAICELRRLGYENKITVISAELNTFYERPPLSKSVLMGESDLENCFIIKPESISSLNLNIIYDNAISINKETKSITLQSGNIISYDKLLIATGGTPIFPFQLESNKNIFTLRSYEDSVSIQKALKTADRVALVGGGWIGLELASSAKKIGLDVTVYERAASLCTRHLDNQSSSYLQNIHQLNGIEFEFNCKDLTLVPSKNKIIINTHEKEQAFDVVIVGAGVSLNTGIAETAGLNVQNGIIVNHKMITSDPHIFAAGDVAIHPSLGFSLQTWANANESAKIAAYSLLDKPYEDDFETPWFWSDQFENNIQILGLFDPSDIQLMLKTDDYTLFLRTTTDGKFKQLISFNFPKIIKQVKRWLKKNSSIDLQKFETSKDWLTLFK